jgi:hypothetical protein
MLPKFYISGDRSHLVVEWQDDTGYAGVQFQAIDDCIFPLSVWEGESSPIPTDDEWEWKEILSEERGD